MCDNKHNIVNDTNKILMGGVERAIWSYTA